MIKSSPASGMQRRIATICDPHLFKCLWLALLVISCATSTQAQQSHPMEFHGYAPPVAAIMGNAWMIFGDGLIDQGTSDRLQKFLSDNRVPYSSNIYLNSNGGNLVEGIKLGKRIREGQLFSYVGQAGDQLY